MNASALSLMSSVDFLSSLFFGASSLPFSIAWDLEAPTFSTLKLLASSFSSTIIGEWYGWGDTVLFFMVAASLQFSPIQEQFTKDELSELLCFHIYMGKKSAIYSLLYSFFSSIFFSKMLINKRASSKLKLPKKIQKG